MPTAMRGRLGSSLAKPASLTALNVRDVLDPHVIFPFLRPMRFHFAMEGLFVHVAVNRVIDFDYRRERALAETGDRAQREFAVGRRDARFCRRCRRRRRSHA